MQRKGMIDHIGIIMDGNRRWAREQHLADQEGHKAGYEKLKEVITWCEEEGIRTLIAYAFSTENWRRTKTEIDFLMKLFEHTVSDFIEQQKKGTQKRRVLFIGDRRAFPEQLQEKMRDIEQQTREHTDFTLVLALSYGGRAEIIRAANTLLMKTAAGEIDAAVSEEKSFARYLYTRDIPDPDLILRTGGHKRLSNFLLWQGAYAELAFTNTYWPALSKKEFNKILDEVSNRVQNFGA